MKRNLIEWIFKKKTIEKEIEAMNNEIIDQDDQYEKVLQDLTKMEGQVEFLIKRNTELEEQHSKQIETIGKLRKKINELKKEIKGE